MTTRPTRRGGGARDRASRHARARHPAHRPPRLSTACVEGVLSSAAPTSPSWMATSSTTIPCCPRCSAASAPSISICGRQPLHRRRAHRGAEQRLPQARQPAAAGGGAAGAEGAAFRSDERLLPDEPPGLRRNGAQPFPAGLQDPARPFRLGAAPASLRRGRLRLQRARFGESKLDTMRGGSSASWCWTSSSAAPSLSASSSSPSSAPPASSSISRCCGCSASSASASSPPPACAW